MRKLVLLFCCLLCGSVLYSQATWLTDNKIRVYNHLMDPRLHPDDNRRTVKPPDAKVFGNKIRFMALRSLEDDYRMKLDQYTRQHALGDIIWPSYTLLYRSDLPEIVREIKNRDLYLFDLWGYVPGSGPGGYWQQFRVFLEEESIEEIPLIIPEPNPSGRGLVLRNITSIREEILLRPEFFQHFDRVVVDWEYFHQRERDAIQEEAGWIKRQGLKIAGDFSSGINLFPDLRLVKNDTAAYDHSQMIIRETIDKMALNGVDEIILTSHKMIENNFTRDQFRESMIYTLREICNDARKYEMKVHFRILPGKYTRSLTQATELVNSVDKPNFYLAPSMGLLLDRPDETDRNPDLLQNLKSDILFVSAPDYDIQGKIWNINKPVHTYPDKEELKNLLQVYLGKAYILDGIYKNSDEEYMDITTMENLF